MKSLRWTVAALLLALAAFASAPLEAQITESGYYYRRGVFRMLQSFHLGPNDVAQDATVIYGDSIIEGKVDYGMQNWLGHVRIAKGAVVGSLLVVAGDVTIEDGATIRRDLVVIGGTVNAPPAFTPGQEYVLIGEHRVGDAIRGVMPWLTRGLLWGRVIVPDLGWVWSVLFVFLVLTLAINLLLHDAVGGFATTLSAKPFSAFATGLLVLLLAGPVSAILAATIIGIAIIPFFVCAILVAWITGKVGVLRWIGRVIFQQNPQDESRIAAIRNVGVGFVVITLLYMIPVVGIVTWALIGVFGLGAATQNFLAGLRRERPAKPPKPPKGGKLSSSEPLRAPAPSFVSAPVEPPMPDASHESHRFEPAPPPPAAPVPPPAAYPPGDLRAFPRASFLDRLAALAIDVILIAIVSSMFFTSRRTFDDEPFMPMLFFAYAALFWAWQGTTLGGIVCNVRIVKANGKRLEFVDAFVRALGGILSVGAFGIGFLWMLRDPEQQTWHDKIAGTVVVKVPKGTPLE